MQYTFYQYFFFEGGGEINDYFSSIQLFLPAKYNLYINAVGIAFFGRISSSYAFCSSMSISSSVIFIYQTTNDAINVRPIFRSASVHFWRWRYLECKYKDILHGYFPLKLTGKYILLYNKTEILSKVALITLTLIPIKDPSGSMS